MSYYRILLLIIVFFFLGYQAHNYKFFPINKFILNNFFPESIQTPKKIFVVSSNITERTEVSCPNPEEALVIIGFGQSNSANTVDYKSKIIPNNIFNFYNGKCYIAKDPLLGAQGDKGSIWIPLAKKLEYLNKKIVLSTFGIGGTKVNHWLDKNNLFQFYKDNLNSLKKIYKNPDILIWIQGESDIQTDINGFNSNLNTWINTLKKDLPSTIIYISGTSYCKGASNHLIVKSQKEISDKLDVNYIGSTDKFIGLKYRYDNCHLNEKGMRKINQLILSSIKKTYFEN